MILLFQFQLVVYREKSYASTTIVYFTEYTTRLDAESWEEGASSSFPLQNAIKQIRYGIVVRSW